MNLLTKKKRLMTLHLRRMMTWYRLTTPRLTRCGMPKPFMAATGVPFETVSWKGHNYQVKWWSQGNQPDLYCGQFDVWKDLGAY